MSDSLLANTAELAKSNEYGIPLKKPTGRKETNPLNGEEQDELSEEVETKNYVRYRISYRDWRILEQLRAQLQTMTLPDERTQKMFQIYEYMARLYLHMPQDEMFRTDFQFLKGILDACKFATDYYGVQGLTH